MNAARVPVDSTRLHWALAALGATTAPHLVHLPVWPIALIAIVVAWRVAVQYGRMTLPGPIVRLLLATAGFAGVLLSYRSVSGLEAGSALLVVMATLKLTETRFVRDLIVLTLISYFLVITQFLFAQSVFSALYAIPELWLVTTALLQIASPAPALPWRRAFGRAGLLLAQAVPVMLIAFVLFPRLSGPFWGIPARGEAGITGLADSMSPGSITRLLQSEAVAFRARFDAAPPPVNERYWRGLVLSDFDGQRWSLFQQRDRAIAAGAVEVMGEPVSYEITLEPHQKNWLFALEQTVPGALPARTYMSSDRRVLRQRPVARLYRYQLRSWPQFFASRDAADWELRRDLQFPTSRNDRSIAMARRWAGSVTNPEALVQRALRHFREQPFAYTLSPPALGSVNPVDDFLFSTRRGFCEHYASAFTLLMRAAGIPARVVIGYQGGEINPFTGHMTVRQSDAHAWSEVWIRGRGWVRIDPTAAVAPERVELGLDGSVPAGESLPGLFRSYAWLHDVQLGWDALNNGWNEWVLGFGKQKQLQVLESLGMRAPTLRRMLLTMIALIAVVLGTLALVLLWQARPVRRDRVARIYASFCRKLAPVAGPRRPGEGPLDFAQRVSDERPDLAASVTAITGLYVDLRYGPPAGARARELRRLVRTLRM